MFVIKATVGVFAQCLFKNRLCTDFDDLEELYLFQTIHF